MTLLSEDVLRVLLFVALATKVLLTETLSFGTLRERVIPILDFGFAILD
ncbi:MAG: hypothetical protein ACFE0I_02080 [Elainellaceae cyanobacterium]